MNSRHYFYRMNNSRVHENTCSWVGTKQLFWNEISRDRCQRWNTFDKKTSTKIFGYRDRNGYFLNLTLKWVTLQSLAEGCWLWVFTALLLSRRCQYFCLVVSEIAQLLTWDVSKSVQRSQPLWKTAQNSKLRDGRFPRECVSATNLCVRQDGCLGESACICHVEWR